MHLKLACRTLLASRWYAATALGTIALSISFAATVFAIVDGVLFKPLPYRAPDQLFHLRGAAADNGTASLAPADVSYLQPADPRVQITAFGETAALMHPNRPDEAIWSANIDPRFFDVLGQYPLVGGFSSSAYTHSGDAAAARPAIVSHRFWLQWLGGRPTLGRPIDMVGTRLTVVGVLPRDFVYPATQGRLQPDVLLPLVIEPDRARDRWARSLDAVARIAPATTQEEARAMLGAALAARVEEYQPAQQRPGPYTAVSLRPLNEYLGANERPLFRLAFAGAALLILLGAVTVAGLFAARGRDRVRELTIRVTLGAHRLDVALVLLSEALVVALAGALFGLLLSQPLLALALALLPDSLMLMKPPVIDWRVAAFAIGSACLVVTVVAVVPAIAVVRQSLAGSLSDGTVTTPRVRSRGRSALLAAESGMGICFTIAGSLALASFIVLHGEDAGFASSLAIVDVRMTDTPAPTELEARYDRIAERLRQTPGVSAVAMVHVPLLENALPGSQFAAPPGTRRRFLVSDIPIRGAFFDVAGLAVVDGRVLTDAEIVNGHAVAVVSQAIAEAYWPDSRAVGQTLSGTERTVTVVGVLEEARFGAQNDTRGGEIYIPRALSRRGRPTFILKTTAKPDATVLQAAAGLQRDVPNVLVRRASTFDEALWKSSSVQHFRSALFTMSALAGLLLVAVGIGGLVATGVARRLREIGIRSALGAQRGQVVGMIVMDHLRPSLAGVAVGLVASWWAMQLLSAYLYQVGVHDPIAWLGAAVTLLAVTSVAAWIPARRAASVDAMTVLKAE